MTGPHDPRHSVGTDPDSAVDEAIGLAQRAPSLHNSRPWAFVRTADAVELRVQRAKQLRVTDPDGHGALVSCGAALHLLQLGLAARGLTVDVQRLPRPDDPDLLARVPLTGPEPTDAATRSAAAADEAAARVRRTEHGPMAARPVPDEVAEQLCAGGESDGVFVSAVRRPEDILGVAVAASRAAQSEAREPGYRAELAAWLLPETRAHFERDLAGDLPFSVGPHGRPLILVVFTDADGPLDWLLAGEALARVLVSAQRLGLAAAPFTRAVDWPGLRARLRSLMAWPAHPQLLVRVGWPPEGAASQTAGWPGGGQPGG